MRRCAGTTTTAAVLCASQGDRADATFSADDRIMWICSILSRISSVTLTSCLTMALAAA